MPYIVAILGLIAGGYFWMNRVRNVSNAAQDLVGVAQDVMSAARRFGFRRRYNEHPVDSLQDPDVAIAGAGLAFLIWPGCRRRNGKTRFWSACNRGWIMTAPRPKRR